MLSEAEIADRFDGLQKGDIIDESTLIEIVGGDLDIEANRLRLMEFITALTGRLWSQGKEFTLDYDHRRLLILNDADASKYNAKWFKSYVKRARKCHHRAMSVDVTGLNDAEKATHDRTLVIQGAMLTSMAAAQREACRQAHVRNTPGLACVQN